MLPVLAAVTGSGALALEIRRAVVVRGRREEQRRAEETIRGLTEALEEAESNWRRAEELVQIGGEELAREKDNVRRLQEGHRDELEHLQQCLELYHTKSKEEVEAYKQALMKFKRELNTALVALKKGLIGPEQLVAIVEEIGMEVETDGCDSNQNGRKTKERIEMKISADWLHQPRYVLNSPDKISRLIASVKRGKEAQSQRSAAQGFPKADTPPRKLVQAQSLDKENENGASYSDPEKLNGLVQELTKQGKKKEGEKKKSKFSFLRSKKGKVEYSPRPSKSGECLTFVLKEGQSTENSTAKQEAAELSQTCLNSQSKPMGTLDGNKLSDKKDARLCSHALKSY